MESSMSSIFNDADGTCELEKPETKEWNWIKFELMFQNNGLNKDSQMFSSHPHIFDC